MRFINFRMCTFLQVSREAQNWLNKEEPSQAVDHIMLHLQQNQFWFNHTQKWWQLMAFCIEIIEKHQLQQASDWAPKLQKLCKIGLYGPQPWGGEQIATALGQLSRWAESAGYEQRAQQLARAAKYAWPNGENKLGLSPGLR